MRVYKTIQVNAEIHYSVWSLNRDLIHYIDKYRNIRSVDIQTGEEEMISVKADVLYPGPYNTIVSSRGSTAVMIDERTGAVYPAIELMATIDYVEFGKQRGTGVIWDTSDESTIVDFQSGCYLFENEDIHDPLGFATGELPQSADGPRWLGAIEPDELRAVYVEDGAVIVESPHHNYTIESPSGSYFDACAYAEIKPFGVVVAQDDDGKIFAFNATSPSRSIVVFSPPSACRVQLIGFSHDGKFLAVHVWKANKTSIKLWRTSRIDAELTENLATYKNAKVVLAGDTGVGKSGLFLRLLDKPFRATESTHAREVAKMSSDNAANDVREVYLWDLAGQPGYRVFHQLSMRDVSVGVVVFDSRDDAMAIRAIRFWAHSLLAMNDPSDPPKLILTSARSDRGISLLTEREIDSLASEFSLVGKVETSAKNDHGIAALRSMVLDSIKWDDLPTIVAPQLFFDARERLLELKDSSVISFVSERELIEKINGNSASHEQSMVLLALRRLEASGVLVKLIQRDLWLLAPEKLDSIVSSMTIAARSDESGLGRISLDLVYNGNFSHEVQVHPVDEDQLIRSAVVEVVERGLAGKVETESGAILVFPNASRTDITEAELDSQDFYCVIRFSGPVSMVYSALTIKMMESGEFGKGAESLRLYRYGAKFSLDSVSDCGYVMDSGDDESRGVLRCFFTDGVPERQRDRFIALAMRQIRQLSMGGSAVIERIYTHCGIPIADAAVNAAIEKSLPSVFCSSCGTSVEVSPIDSTKTSAAWAAEVDGQLTVKKRREIRQMRQATNFERRLYQTFICYNTVDRPVALTVYNELSQRGFVPWIDVHSEFNVSNALKKIEDVISSVPTAVVCIGPTSIGVFQELEFHAFIMKALYPDAGAQKFRLAVLLLPGADESSIPYLLKPTERFDISVPGNRESELVRLEKYIDGSQ